MPAPFANLSVVLVEPSSPGNIGAVARVLRNTGISNLHLVNPCPWDNLEARARAHGSTDILENCRLFPDLASAVSEAHIVVGTTHRDGRNRVVDSDPRAVVEELAPHVSSQRVALVFGREKDGLWRDELALCHRLVRFPTATAHPSFNLSHAVVLLAHEFFYALKRGQGQRNSQQLATAQERKHLFDNLHAALEAVNFRPFNDNDASFRRVVRRFFNRVPLERRDTLVIHRICSQIRRFARRQTTETD